MRAHPLSLTLLLLVATPTAALDRIAGTVRHAERVALPDDALLMLELYDATPRDARTPRLARLALATRGRQVPLAFELPFHPEDILPAHRYVLRATLIDGSGALLFATPKPVPVLTQGATGQVDVVVERPHAAPPAVALENTYWKLTEVDGNPARPEPGQREAHLLLLDGRVSGNSGCNKLMGSYTHGQRSALSIGPLASTRMACTATTMAQEAALLEACARTTGYRIEGESLALLSGDLVVARFVSRYFK